MLKRWMIALAALTMAGLACDLPGGTSPPTPTLFVLPTLPLPSETPTLPPAGPTDFPTAAPLTAEPTQGLPSFPTPTSLAQPGGADRVQIYLIALEDSGKSGEPVGCGDSVVPVEVEIAPTQALLRAAIEQLIAIKDQFYGQSGLYNALYTNQFTVDKVTIDGNGVAQIELNGAFNVGGVCDEPRVVAQLTQTALQFQTVTDARIVINGTLLQDLFKQTP